MKRRQGTLGDTWYLDEVFVTIQGQRQYLWRAVDQDGDTLDILVQRRRDRRAAERFFRKLLKGLESVPRTMVTDKLKSYSAARRTTMPSVVRRDAAIRKQSGRGLPRAYSAAGVPDAPFQVAGASPALPSGTRGGGQSLPARSTSHPGRALSDVSCPSFRAVAGGDVRLLKARGPAHVPKLPGQGQLDSTLGSDIDSRIH